MRDGSFAWNRGSMRTEPVKYWAGPFLDGCEPLRVTVTAEKTPDPFSSAVIVRRSEIGFFRVLAGVEVLQERPQLPRRKKRI